MDGAQLGQEGVVRRERIPEEGVRVGAIAVGGGEGRRYREAGTDPLLRYSTYYARIIIYSYSQLYRSYSEVLNNE